MMQKVSLEFLARQCELALGRLGAIEDRLTVMTGMAIRHEGALTGLATEFRGLVPSVSGVGHRLRKMKDSGV